MADLIQFAAHRAPKRSSAPVCAEPGPDRWLRCWACSGTGIQRGRCGPCAGFGLRAAPVPARSPAPVIPLRLG